MHGKTRSTTLTANRIKHAMLPTPPRKVLVIEDEATQVLSLRSQLKTSGFDVSYAMNGEVGVYKALAEKPDVVLLDIMLPGMSGLDVCQRLKTNTLTRHIPVIFVTASKIDHLREQCHDLGASEIIIKPYTAGELVGAIQRTLSAPAT